MSPDPAGRVLVAMSGGVDSSVAALLLRQAGFDVAGATMRLFDSTDSGAGGTRDVEDARAVAHRLGMEHFELDGRAVFRETVMARFAEGYRRGETPNPCVDCNRIIKFGWLLEQAKRLGFDRVATGHYARIDRDSATGRLLLRKGRDPDKDQSYVLYTLSQEQLGRTLLPLGSLTKEDVRTLAERHGLVNARKSESQDICFIPDGAYAAFIERYTGRLSEPGDFTDAAGTVLGRHRGLIRYTVGQRRGLGIASDAPWYVLRKDPARNRVVLGRYEELFSEDLYLRDVNLIAVGSLEAPVSVSVRTRYHQKETAGTLYPPERGLCRFRPEQPVRSVAPGQSAVYYRGDVVFGGGILCDPQTVSEETP